MSLGQQSEICFPTQVQVTVVRAADLQPKGKNRTNDVYTIIQLGKEKYSTSVAEKTLSPIWREEASFELPGLLLEGNTEVFQLCLVVMHRSLVGLDKFLGQKTINLSDFFNNKERGKTVWYTLDSKPGKKCKERGRIQVSIQFTRNNKTSSMFELSVQSKPRSPFFKLKDKMKGCKQHSGNFSDSSSALPSFGPCSSIAKPQHQGSEHPTQLQSEPEPIQSLLVRKHKLSAAQSLSDLIGSNFCSKMDSASENVSPHWHNQAEGYSDTMSSDPVCCVKDCMPQKYATLPRNHNPFEVDQNEFWEPREQSERKENVEVLKRKAWKKRGKNMKDYGRSGSSGNLQSANPFRTDLLGNHNPFNSHYRANDNMRMPVSKSDLSAKQRTSPGKTGINQNKESGHCQASVPSYSNLSFDEVVQELLKQKEVVKKKDAHIRELEDYIDDLLVRVMEETPSILRTPYEPKRKAEKIYK
ncbi:rab11 family-interacting protein 2 [Clupea harengus]|uniref:Rab11 family-interacting protein 2 n=1 Tax=Clupea harengus TaxID=7950 RepID=A0A6P8GKA2_CLUHA|nr:rab11 family-interacting protein 2 [Clupea harengus]